MIGLCGDFFGDLPSCIDSWISAHASRTQGKSYKRVKSCTRSLSSTNSSLEGGEKFLGCLVDAARLKASL